jgi:RNA-directed DNA polymerase
LLANICLNAMDQQREKREHACVRFADDGKIYVRSLKAGARVLAFLRKK